MNNKELEYKQFAKNLRKIHADSNKTQVQVSKDLGITSVVYNQWLHGITMPKAYHLKRVADYFHVTVNDLLYENPTLNLSPEEAEIIRRYRFANVMDKALVKKVLGIDETEKAKEA